MKTDHDRKIAAIKRYGEIVLGQYSIAHVRFDECRKTIGIDTVNTTIFAVSTLNELRDIFQAGELEVVTGYDGGNITLDIWITDVGRWPWEM